MSHTYAYPRPALTVDCVVFGLDDEDLKVLLIQRDKPPHQGAWAELESGESWFVHFQTAVPTDVSFICSQSSGAMDGPSSEKTKMVTG